MNKIPINPNAREAFNKMKNEMGSDITIDKGKLPSRLFSFHEKNENRLNVKNSD
ncbi:hypothetical protein QBE52_07390 [Clostridiaceae bacterium 35-E11]